VDQPELDLTRARIRTGLRRSGHRNSHVNALAVDNKIYTIVYRSAHPFLAGAVRFPGAWNLTGAGHAPASALHENWLIHGPRQ